MPIKTASLRYAVCGCCLCIKNANCYNLIIAYLLEEQNTLCTPPAGGKEQSSGNSSSANSASVNSFSFSITPSDSSRRAVSSGIRYLETDLLPHLNGNSVLVMDNMKSHHAKAVKELLDSSGVRYIYLPQKSTILRRKYGAFLFAEAGFWGLHCFACTVFRLFAGGSDTPPTFDVTPFAKKNVCRPVHRIYSICRSFVFMPIFS